MAWQGWGKAGPAASESESARFSSCAPTVPLSASRQTCGMTERSHTLLQDVLALPEDERLQLASAIIASVNSPPKHAPRILKRLGRT
jgi:hypothetical protein